MRKSRVEDPFLLSSSLVIEGSSTAIVCCVGDNSRRVLEEFDTDSKTPLQKRLITMSGSLSKIGIYASGIIFLASIINFVIRASTDSNYNFADMMNDLVNYITQAFTIVIVAVPDGLPLVITMSLAYSVSMMKNDGLIIKKTDVPEKSARIKEILIGKTTTLTTGDLSVANFYICDQDR
jgi:Ca2+-transporting ATPase